MRSSNIKKEPLGVHRIRQYLPRILPAALWVLMDKKISLAMREPQPDEKENRPGIKPGRLERNFTMNIDEKNLTILTEKLEFQKQMQSDRITLPCSGGFTLYTDGENITIVKGKTEEAIPISVIQSFSLKKPGIMYGTIEFTTARAAAGGINIGHGIIAALGAQKTFYYFSGDFEIAKQFRDIVVNYNKPAARSESAPAGTVVSVVEEIRGLKTLLDEGILTQEEFNAKKKQLLGI